MTEHHRIQTVTQRVDRQFTGFKASLYIHVDHLPNGRVVGVRFSDKGKDGSTLDNILSALGDQVTDIIDELANPHRSTPPPPEPKNPRVCETPGCGGPKQPGKAHCSACLTKAYLTRTA